MDEQRRAYRAGWKRLQRREAEANGTLQDIHGHDGDESEDETLSEKLTRLRRETRDVIEQLERSRAGGDDQHEKSVQARKQEEEIRGLCKLMEKARKDYEGLESNALAELEKVVDATKRPATSALDPQSVSFIGERLSPNCNDKVSDLLTFSSLLSRLYQLVTPQQLSPKPPSSRAASQHLNPSWVSPHTPLRPQHSHMLSPSHLNHRHPPGYKRQFYSPCQHSSRSSPSSSPHLPQLYRITSPPLHLTLLPSPYHNHNYNLALNPLRPPSPPFQQPSPQNNTRN